MTVILSILNGTRGLVLAALVLPVLAVSGCGEASKQTSDKKQPAATAAAAVPDAKKVAQAAALKSAKANYARALATYKTVRAPYQAKAAVLKAAGGENAAKSVTEIEVELGKSDAQYRTARAEFTAARKALTDLQTAKSKAK